MSKVYIETLSSSLYSRTLWDSTGGTNYVVGDRVSLDSSIFSYSSGTVDDLHDRIYVCISDNNSTSYPFNEPNNWVVAGSSEEYPVYAVDGQLGVNSMSNEVYLEHQADRYKGNGSNRFTWHQATAQGTGHGELIFGDGEYTGVGASFTIDKLSYTAKNSGKVFITTDGFGAGAIFQGKPAATQPAMDAIEVSMMTGITFIVFGTRSIHGNNLALGLHGCVIKDTNASPYTPGQFRVGNSNCYIDVENTSFNLPNTSLKLLGYQPVSHRDKKCKIVGSTFYMGNYSNQYAPINYGSPLDIEISKCIFAFLTTDHSDSSNFRLGAANPDSKDNVIFCYDNNVVPPTEEENCLVMDPLFINREIGDFRLRPSSPLIGGFKSSSTNEIYVTPGLERGTYGGSDNPSFFTYSDYTGQTFLPGMRTSQNGEIYECLNNDSYDSTKDLSSDATNWRLVQGTIDDPYKTSDFGDSTINDKLTSDHELILLDGDYNYFPLTSDSSYPTTSPVLRALNTHKAIIYSNVRPAGFITKDLVFQNSLVKSGYVDYPLDGRVGFHVENCVIHSGGTWWPPLNTVVKSCLIFQELTGNGMFYGGFGQASSPQATDKAITFISNTVIFTGSLDGTPGDTVLSSLINQGYNNATFKSNIFYVKSGFNPGSVTKFVSAVFNHDSNVLNNGTGKIVNEKNIVFDENGVIVDDLRGMTYIDPKLVDTSSNEYGSYRLRPDSPCIGGISNKRFTADTVWVQPGSGTGTGTEDDPFYWSQYSDAFFAATQTTSKQVVFKDGEYAWTNAVLQDDNVGNSITMIAENMHKAFFHDNTSRLSSSGKNPTLRFKGIKLETRDHFTWTQECHYVLDSCHFLIVKYFSALSIRAKGCIFEIGTGVDSYVFSNSGSLDVQNCIFTDHNDRQSGHQYFTRGDSGNIKNSIFYSKYPRNTCFNSDSNATLINCASQNITNPENGVEFIDNLQFIDIENKNYNLRPLSPLIGQGK